MPAIVANWAQFDAHIHDGVTSAKLNAVVSLVLTTQAISSGAWGASLGGGRYRQLVTLPIVAGTQITFDAVNISMRNAATGEVILPSVVKVSSTTYYVYTVDNSLAFTALYSV